MFAHINRPHRLEHIVRFVVFFNNLPLDRVNLVVGARRVLDFSLLGQVELVVQLLDEVLAFVLDVDPDLVGEFFDYVELAGC